MPTDDQKTNDSTDVLLTQAEKMIWSLLDNNLSGADFSRLEELIRDNPQVRNRYFECVQLHTDLASHFGKATQSNALNGPDSPVLGSLGNTLPGTDPASSIAEQ